MKTLPHTVPVVLERECEVFPNTWTITQLRGWEIHVWRQNLDLPLSQVEAFASLLSNDEQIRARRFRFDIGRTEFVVSRGTLRVLLGAYQGVPADRLQFAYSEFGRPRLARNLGSDAIEFNISHSAGVTLLAFSRHHRIGIDVEKVGREFNAVEIAENFFSQSERARLRHLPTELQHEAFFRCWTRKEAFIKALGEGLSHPLDAFDVSLAPGEPAALLATRPDAREAARWTLREIVVPYGYVATLAVELLAAAA